MRVKIQTTRRRPPQHPRSNFPKFTGKGANGGEHPWTFFRDDHFPMAQILANKPANRGAKKTWKRSNNFWWIEHDRIHGTVVFTYLLPTYDMKNCHTSHVNQRQYNGSMDHTSGEFQAVFFRSIPSHNWMTRWLLVSWVEVFGWAKMAEDAAVKGEISVAGLSAVPDAFLDDAKGRQLRI